MTKITTDFVGSETIAVTKQRLTDILAYWGASTAAYTTWGQARTALNALLTSTTAGTIGSTELAGTFLPKINFLNDPDDMIADALFGAGEQGVWLDPSDLTTMFQDAAGTTPVTAPGQPVGLRLDKSKGLALGPELVVNGSFATDTGWTKGTGWTISGGVGVGTNVNTTSLNSTAFTTVVGRTYKASFQLVTRTAGTVALYAYDTSNIANIGPLATPGSYTFVFVARQTSTTLYFFSVDSFSGTIDSVSLKELPGNHATQSTAGSRPMYGIEPKGGRRNLLTWSEGFDDASWLKGGITVAANNATAPNGTTTADTLTSTGSPFALYVSLTGTAARYTASAYFKAGTDTAPTLFLATIGNGAGGAATFNLTAVTATTTNYGATTGTTATITSVGSGWYRCTLSVTLTAATYYYQVSLSSTALTLAMWGAQLELGSTATNYQRVTTAFDVTEAGVNTCHYCQYDGSDDGMVTNSIDFTATDKMSVFAGVRRLSNATAAILAELSTNSDTVAGSFSVWAPSSNGGTQWYMQSRGNAGANASASGYAVPVSNVFAGLTDISGDSIKVRVDGTQVAQSTTDQGTGNFGNHILSFGRRSSGTAPFYGRDYGIIVTGKLANATAIATTEMWLANKTSGVSL